LAIVVSFRGKLLCKNNLRREPRWPPSILRGDRPHTPRPGTRSSPIRGHRNFANAHFTGIGASYHPFFRNLLGKYAAAQAAFPAFKRSQLHWAICRYVHDYETATRATRAVPISPSTARRKLAEFDSEAFIEGIVRLLGRSATRGTDQFDHEVS
jgi:hypothetical protein